MRTYGLNSVFAPMLILVGSLCAKTATAQPVQWNVNVGGNGNYFEVVVLPGSITGAAAREAAQSLSYLGRIGILATASTQPKDEFIRNLAVTTTGSFTIDSLGGLTGPWIGGIQIPGSTEPAEGWTWINGEAWTYTNWLEGEPNQGGSSGTSEDALHLYSRDPLLSPANVYWNDLASGPEAVFAVHSFVVEYVVPSPTSATLLFVGGIMFSRRRRS